MKDTMSHIFHVLRKSKFLLSIYIVDQFLVKIVFPFDSGIMGVRVFVVSLNIYKVSISLSWEMDKYWIKTFPGA